jgi:hypothetical protein
MGTAIVALTALMVTAAPAPLGAEIAPPVDFGTVPVGTTTAAQSEAVPLTTTVGAQRSAIAAAISNATITPITETIGLGAFGTVSVTLTGDQQRLILSNALAALPDSTVFAVKINSLGSSSEFPLSGDCDGADGATRPTCTVSATFTPSAPGIRQRLVDVTLSVTQGYDAFGNAIATAAAPVIASAVGLPVGVVGPIVSAIEPTIAATALPVVSVAVQEAINPIMDLQGTGTTTASIDPISVVEGNSGTTIVHVPVHLNAFPGNPVQVVYTTSDDTATARGKDYQATTGTVTFAPGTTNATADVPIVGDTKFESNETFTVTLSSPVNAFIGTASATVTILDDEARMKVVASSVPEGADVAFAVTIMKPLSIDSAVHWHTNDGTATDGNDYTGVTDGEFIVPAGSRGPIIVNVPTIVDGLKEVGETFSATFVGATATVTAKGTIKGNDW